LCSVCKRCRELSDSYKRHLPNHFWSRDIFSSLYISLDEEQKKGGNMSIYIYTDAGPFKSRKRKKKVQDEIDAWLPTTTTRAKI